MLFVFDKLHSDCVETASVRASLFEDDTVHILINAAGIKQEHSLSFISKGWGCEGDSVSSMNYSY